MFDDLSRSVREAVSDGYNNPESTTPKSFLQNITERFKGRLLFSLMFFLVFGVAAIGIILMILFFVFKSL